MDYIAELEARSATISKAEDNKILMSAEYAGFFKASKKIAKSQKATGVHQLKQKKQVKMVPKQKMLRDEIATLR